MTTQIPPQIEHISVLRRLVKEAYEEGLGAGFVLGYDSTYDGVEYTTKRLSECWDQSNTKNKLHNPFSNE